MGILSLLGQRFPSKFNPHLPPSIVVFQSQPAPPQPASTGLADLLMVESGPSQTPASGETRALPLPLQAAVTVVDASRRALWGQLAGEGVIQELSAPDVSVAVPL